VSASGEREPGALHPELTAEQRRRRIAAGSTLFARGEFFAAHEAWEEVWRSTTPDPRDLFQGLVQMAAAFHHLRVRRRPDVARRVIAKARRRLSGVDERGGGIDLRALLAGVDRWQAWLDAGGAGDEPELPPLRWTD
jgi:predicted metal-dependent hydrolase